MQLSFTNTQLSGNALAGTGSYLKLTSLKDGYFQYLDAKTIREWNYRSAYFNGDIVLIELISEPGAPPARVGVDGATVGFIKTQNSQCGPTDDRVLSNEPANARLLPIGCTAWIIDDDCGCLLSAGHCSGGLAQTVQFNVPLSNSNGSLNNPPPSDQYSVDTSSKQFVNGGIGNDWGYFGVFPNSTTGLKPIEKQGDAYSISVPPAWNSSLDIRITGYGVDGGTRNQVQQTHAGPWLSPIGTRLNYQADTTGGNSGSPVVETQSGLAIGIHCHAGCNTSGGGSNSGSSFLNTGLQAALDNPQGVCQAAICGTTGSTSLSNGTGANPLCFTSVTQPVIGQPWVMNVNTSGVAGAVSSTVQGFKRSALISTAAGELLLDQTSRELFTLTTVGTGTNSHTITVPNEIEIIGFTLNIQGWVNSAAGVAQYCNAFSATVGCQ